MEKLIEESEAFKYLTFGKDTDMLPYDDNVKAANWRTLKDECKLAAVRKVFTKIYADKLYQEIADNQFKDEEILRIYHEFRTSKEEKLGNILWITFNPQPDVTFQDFFNQSQNFIKKKWVISAIWVIEQRGQSIEELGKGYHAHFLVWRQPDKRPNQVIKETKSHFRKFCNAESHSCLRIENCKEQDIEYRKNYMLGEKKFKEGDDKHLKQYYDVKWRQLIGEPSYYSKNISVSEDKSVKE
jgi:hypothetical protein